MKDKMFMFIIGILLGAVIATGAFYVYSNSKKCDCTNSNSSSNNGQGMPNGQPPEKPDGDSSSNGQQPQMPSNSGNGSSTTQSTNN